MFRKLDDMFLDLCEKLADITMIPYVRKRRKQVKKAYEEIEAMNTDTETKEALQLMALMTNKDYKKSNRVRNTIKYVQENTNADNTLVQSRIQEIVRGKRN